MIIISCKQATELASQGLDRRLGFGERLALHLHLTVCRGCRHFRAQAAFLRKAMQRLVDFR